jgi:hypothetical protein
MNGHAQPDILANIDTSYTPLSDLPKIHKELNETFLSRKTRPIEWRKQQLLQLARLIKDNHEAIASAIHTDLGRPYLETYQAELAPCLDRTLITLNKLSEWAATEDKSAEVPDWQKSWDVKVFKEPKGVALIIAPWNYPCILSIQPFLGALSAGCPAVLKVSEVAPTYGNLLRRLFERYLDRSAFRVVTGGVEEITSLLEMKWDHSEFFITLSGIEPHAPYSPTHSLLHRQRHHRPHHLSRSGQASHTGHTRVRRQIPGRHRPCLSRPRPRRQTNPLREDM